MKNKGALLITFFFLLLLLNGCTQMTRAEKNLCTTLSSKSYAYIPNCETESSCFNNVSSLFKTKLNYEEESILYEIKNHIARSWYFYNLSLKEQKNIQSFCKANNPLSAAGALNQAQDLINTSFFELDLGMKKSFELIALEEKKFTLEEIDLLKEEQLYASLISFRQILSELNTGATNSDTYVSYYTKKAEDFAKSSAAKGFPVLVEKSPFWIEHYDIVSNTILDELGIEKKGYFPLANDLLNEVISQAEVAFFKKQSLLALQKFPFYEFMKLYSDLGGNNNSALKRFADLINNTSNEYTQLNKKIQTSWENNEKNLIIINELINKDSKSEEFEALASKLIQKTITTNSNLTFLTKSTILDFIELKEQKYLSKLTKGQELLQLNKLETNFNELIQSLQFKTNGFEEKLIQACKIEANKELKIDINSNSELNKLLEEVTYFSSRTKNTTGRECLLSCREMVAKKENLNNVLKDVLLFESISKDNLKECVGFLEKIFNGESLFEQKALFEELKKNEITKENLNTTIEKCNLIKKKVENELKLESIYLNLEEEYNKLQTNLKEFNLITTYLNEKEIFNLKENYFNKSETFNQYFINSKVIFEKITNVKELILEKLITLNKELKKSIEEKTIYYVEKNIIFSKLNSEVIKLNENNYSENRLIINNPFQEINKEIFLRTNFDINSISNKDGCVDSVFKNLITLFYLPKGKTKIDFFKELTITSEEKDSFVNATNELSLLKREISLIPNIDAQNVLITTTQPQNTISTIILINSKEVLFATENNKTKFLVEKVMSNTKIEIFYYISNVINLNKELIQTKTTDFDETLIYKLTAQNNLSQKITASLLISLPSTSAEINLYSNDYTKKEIKKVGDKIILQNQPFLEKETKYFEVWVKTSNSLEYYIEGLEKQESFFIEHNYPEKANNTKKIREGENIDLMKRLFESNSEEIEKIETQEKNKSSLELMKQKILEKIEELRNKQNKLNELGLITEAQKIGTTIDSIISEQLNTEKDIASAFDKLVALSSSADNKLKSEVEKMWGNITIKSENEEKLITLKNMFFDKKQLFDEKFSFDQVETNQIFKELQKDYASFLEISKEIDKNNSLKQKELTNKLNSDLSYCESTLILLEKDLLENNSSLIKAKFVYPLTQSRIERLHLILEEIKNSNKTIEEKIKLIEPIKDEIWEATEIIKKQAILAFNTAVDNKLSKEILLEGKTLLDQNKYIDAYLVLFDNSSPAQTLLNFVWFLPILIVLIVAYILKNKIGKREEENKEKKKIIMNEWEKLD